MISHELRTPLNSIIGFSNILKAEASLPDQQESIDSIIFSSGALLRIINEVLDFSKIEEGKLELESTFIDLKGLLSSILLTHKLQATDKKISLDLVYDDAIPLGIKFDELRLGQIIQNLLSNAVKFTDKGGVTLTASLVSKTAHQVELQFAVDDTGIGVAEANKDKIFDSFAQAENTINSQFGGTGLGLSISRQLVELMGGYLKMDSTLGQGTTFYFSLKTDYTDSLTSAAPKDQNAIAIADFNKAKVLVADDNEMNVLVISKFLNRWNIYPDVAADGQEALDLATANNYDLILMDLVMPNMSGKEAVQAIRAQGGHNGTVAILALTASSETEIKALMDGGGFDSFINKPFSPQDLYDKLAAYLPLV